VALTGVVYLILGTLYVLTIWTTGGEPIGAVAGRVGIDYAIKGLLTLPFWWVIVRLLDPLDGWRLLAVHAVGAPLFIALWFQAYYAVLPAFGFRGLSEAARAWDIFIPALIYALMFGGFHMVRYVTALREQTEREKELVDVARRREMAALRAQLNPHFLFNAFNSISASVPPELEHTRSIIAQLARLLRYTLDAGNRRRVALGVEIDFLRQYLQLEKERFEERLDVEIDVDDAALDVRIPPMLLQPLVENAVRHGIAPTLNGGTVRILIRRDDEGIDVEVSDSGAGAHPGTVDDPPGDGLGLRATRRSLRLLYDTALHVDTAPGAGFTARFRIPVAADVPEPA
jgi:signal transduction histidine kinase